jgi:RHS repeat-associated protein
MIGFKTEPQSAINPWTYAGKRIDPLTGWYQFGRRFYSPTIGRFITQDPAGISASPNLYAYLMNSPLVHYDTYGLFEFASIRTIGEGVAHIGFYIMRSVVRAPFHIVNNTRMVAGSALEKLSYNLIPINYIKDIPQAAGYFLKNMTMEGYEPSYKGDTSQWIIHNGTEKGGFTHISINGIMNTLAEAFAFAEMVSNAHGGATVHHFFGASHGLVQDLCECVLQIVGVRTHQVKEFEKGLIERIDKIGRDGIATIDAHSRGAITLSRVLPNLETDKVNRLWIATYGGGNIIQNNNALRCYNYIKTHDCIPLLGDPYTYFGAIFGNSPSVEFVKSSNIGFEHGFEKYKSQLTASAEQFSKRFGK